MVFGVIVFYFLSFACSTNGQGLKVYWNIPSKLCSDADRFDPEKYSIITNANQTFLGDRILTLYEGQLGLYPRIITKNLGISGIDESVDGADGEEEEMSQNAEDDARLAKKLADDDVVELINGGIPQRADFKSHVKKIKKDINKLVKRKRRFNGLVVIDYEAWRPLYNTNYGSKRVYQEESVKFVKERFQNISDRFARVVAEKEFNSAAKKFMLKTIRTVRRLLPNAIVGFYGFPECNFDAGEFGTRCSKEKRAATKQLSWLFAASSGLFPSIYYYNGRPMDKAWRQRYTHAKITEALSVRKAMGRSIPIYPFTSFYYNDTHFYNKSDVCSSTVLAAGYNIQGLILWSSSTNMKARCHKMNQFIQAHYGPKIHKLIQNVDRCDKNVCNNNGRCVRKKLAPPFDCNSHKWTSELYRCECKPGFVGDNCDFEFRQFS